MCMPEGRRPSASCSLWQASLVQEAGCHEHVCMSMHVSVYLTMHGGHALLSLHKM